MAWEDLLIGEIDKVFVLGVSENAIPGLLTRELWQKAVVLSVGIKLVLNLFNGAMKF